MDSSVYAAGSAFAKTLNASRMGRYPVHRLQQHTPCECDILHATMTVPVMGGDVGYIRFYECMVAWQLFCVYIRYNLL